MESNVLSEDPISGRQNSATDPSTGDKLREQIAALELQLKVYKQAESVGGIGNWQINLNTFDTWFSDNIYRLYGLEPHSFKAHPDTFSPFIHQEDREVVMQAFDKSFRESIPLHLEYRIHKIDGTERHFRTATSISKNAKGEPLLTGITEDITERKNLELQLGEAEESLNLQRESMLQAEQNGSFGTWQINLTTRHAHYSDNFLRIFGLKPATPSPGFDEFLNLINPNDRSIFESIQKKIFEDQEAPDAEFRIMRPDGRNRKVRVKSKLLKTADGDNLIMGMVQDITPQRNLEEKLRAINERLTLQNEAFLQSERIASMGSGIWNLTTNQTIFSDNVYNIYGLKPQSVLADWTSFLNYVHLEDRSRLEKIPERIRTEPTAQDFRYRIIRSDGELRHLRARGQSIESPQGHPVIIWTVQDITDEVLLQKRLKEQMKFAEMLGDTIVDKVMVTNAYNSIIDWNGRSERAFGLKKEEVLGRNLFELFPKLKTPQITEQYKKALAGETIHIPELKSVFTGGYEELTMVPIKDETGKVLAVLSILHDLTEQHKLRQELNERLEFIEKLLESSVDEVAATDTNMRFVYWNRRAEEVHRLKKENVIGKHLLEVFPLYVHQSIYQQVKTAYKGETIHIPVGENMTSAKPDAETYLIPIKKTIGEVIGLLWITHDLGSERLLRLQKKKFHEVIDVLNENYLELDSAYQVIHANAQAESFFGRDRKAVEGHPVWEFFSPETDSALAQAIKQAMEEGTPARTELFLNSKRVWLNFSIAPTPDGIMMLFFDIHDTKEIQQKTEAAKELMEMAISGVSASISFWDRKSGITLWDDRGKEIMGFKTDVEAQDINGWVNKIHPDDREAVLKAAEHSIETGEDFKIHYRIDRGNGDIRYVYGTARMKLDEKGSVAGSSALIIDLTPIKKTEQKLEETHEFLRKVMESTPDMVAVKNLETMETYYMNEVSEDMVGFSGRELMDMTWERKLERIHPADIAATDEYFKKMRGVLDEEVHSLNFRFQHKDGRWVQLRYRGKILQRKSNGMPLTILILIQDITEQQQAETHFKETHDLLQSVLDGTTNGIIAFKSIRSEEGEIVDFQYILLNDEAEEILQRKDLVGKRILSEFPGTALVGWYQHAVNVTQTGEPWEGEFYYGYEGYNMWFYSAITKLADGCLATFQNISEKKHAEHELQEHRNLIDKIASTNPIAITLHDAANNRIIYSNKTEFRFDFIPGIKEMNMEDRIKATVHPDDLSGTIDFLLQSNHLRNDEQLEHQFRMQVSPGNWEWFTTCSKVFKHDQEGKAEQIICLTNNINQRKKAEEETAKQRSLLQQAEEIAHLGHWEWNPVSGDLHWSDEIYRIYGYPPQSFRPDYQFYIQSAIDEQEQKKLDSAIQEAISGHQSFMHRARIRTADGSVKYVNSNGRPEKNEAGEVIRVIGTIQDVTEQQKLEEELRQKTEVLSARYQVYKQTEALRKVGNWQWNIRTGRITWSENMFHLFGFEQGGVEPKFETLLQLIHPEDREFVRTETTRSLQSQIKEGRQYDYRILLDGKIRYMRSTNKVIKNEKGKFLIGTEMDITEDALLRQKMQDLNNSLQQKNRQLEEMNEELNSFAFIASHDLREPLRKIQVFSDRIMNIEADKLSKQAREHFMRVLASIRRMEELIDDILSFSSLNASEQTYVYFDLNQVLDDVLMDMQEEIEKKKAIIEKSNLPMIEGIPSHFSHLFRNLLGNALKYQSKDNIPRIRIFSNEVNGKEISDHNANEKSHYLQITVSDNGIGFDQQFAGKIFQMFQRLHGMHEYPGTGMGLAICKKVVEIYHGFISASGSPGEGATFNAYFKLKTDEGAIGN